MQYVGDAVMAVFGAPDRRPTMPKLAIAVAATCMPATHPGRGMVQHG